MVVPSLILYFGGCGTKKDEDHYSNLHTVTATNLITFIFIQLKIKIAV